MVLSKKQGLILAAAAIGGTGLALMVLGKGKENGDEGDEKEEPKKERMMIRYEHGVYAPSTVYAPYSERTITDIVHNIFAPQPQQAPPPVPATTPDVRKTIKGAHKKVVSEGFDVSTTFTGTQTSPAFVQRDIYHKQMLAALGMDSKANAKPATTTPKKQPKGARTAKPGRMGYGKSYASRHGL